MTMNCLYALVFIICLSTIFPGFEGIGVNYGLNGDNLPSPSDVISLLKSRKISKIRVFEPNQNVLKALEGSGISVIIGTRNEDLQPLASSLTFATNWVQTNVLPFVASVGITCISAGNEVEASDGLTQHLPVAIQNLNSALMAANLNIPVTTTVSMAVFASTYPPSQATFSAKAMPVMAPITKFLESKRYPLIVNIYSYFPLASDSKIPLDYALLKDTAVANPDGAFVYRNLFDAMLDSAYAALEKAGGPNVEVVVGETGWPSGGGGALTNAENAKVYNNNLVRHVESGGGTPRRPGKKIEAYIFALFNENLKPGGVEHNWGLYYPNMTEVYHVDF